ncbi:MAG: regulatory protein RecX [Gammaproteobacteria bacterium]
MKPSSPAPPPEQDAEETRQRACAAALRLLARREHSVLELCHKLAARGFADEVIGGAVEQLSRQNLLSDRRFADAYVRGRADRGFGPLRIQAELRERGIATSLMTETLMELSGGWVESAARQRDKRFGPGVPADKRERAKQMRFLQQRGFTAEQIRTVLGG